MYSLIDSNNICHRGGGATGAAVATAGAASASMMRPIRQAYHVNQQYMPVMSYTQMLRMSLEEEGEEDMGSLVDCSGREGAYGNFYNQRAAVEVKEESHVEGFAENDYDFTCLTLGTGRPASDGTFARVEPATCSVEAAVAEHALSSAGRSSFNGVTRTCTLCGTSKTPLWRSGPMGAKSLCNACGIRSKKAKKLAAALSDEHHSLANATQKRGTSATLKRAAVAPSGVKSKSAKRKMMIPARERETGIVKKKLQPQLFLGISSPVKTETSSCLTSPGTPSPCSTQRKPCLASSMLFPPHVDDAIFPKDEEQAAFLLMALSCGLVLAN